MGLLDLFKTEQKALIINKVKSWMFLGGETYSLYNTDFRDAINNGYEKNVDVYAIVSDIASRAVEVPLELYQSNGKQSIKSINRYKSLMNRPTDRSIMLAKELRRKEMREIEGNGILDLLKRPNSYQSSKDFFEALFSYYLLLGDVGIYAEEDPIKPGKIARIHVIAPYDYQIIVDGYRNIKEYKIMSLNASIDPKYFLSFRSFNPQYGNLTSINRGFSPLTSGSRVLQKANASEEVAIENFETRGAVGVLYKDDNNTEDLDAVEQQDYEDKVSNKIYNSYNKGRIAFSNAKMGYLKLSTNNLELDLRALSKLSTEQLCRLWHYPYVLLNADNLTESNLAQFIRRMIINCVVPLQSKVCEKLLEWLAPTYGMNPNQYVLRFDVDAYPEMKQNFLDAATILEKLDGVLSQDEKRVFMDFEPTNDPIMNQVYIRSNQVPLGSLNIDPNAIGNFMPETENE